MKGTEHFIRAWNKVPPSPCEQHMKLSDTWWRCDYYELCKSQLMACATFERFVFRGKPEERSRTDHPSRWRYERLHAEKDND